MAYAQPVSPNRRLAAIGGVAALHAAAVYALLSGFAVTVIEIVEDRIVARHIPADPPPPAPTPSIEPSPAVQDFIAPRPMVDLNRTATEATVVDLVPIVPQPYPTATATAAALPIAPSPTPSFAARSASPLGSPGLWATSADYPARALREERAGVTRFQVTIGTDGKVRTCEVTASSGSADLDRATCANVSKRARFRPAIDGSGAKIEGSYSNAIRWEIPG